MSDQLTPIYFEKLIQKHFKFLQDNYGYDIYKIQDWQYHIESKNSRVIILNEHGSLTVAIEPIGDGARQLLQQNIVPSKVEVTVISKCLDPKLDYKPHLLGESNYSHDIPLEINERVVLLKKYCEKLLRGDFSQWNIIKECL